MVANGQLATGRAQNLLAGCIFVGVADKSAFALLSQKVTKAMRRIRRSLPDREKGKFIEADNQRYDRERLCQPQQQKIPCKEYRSETESLECGILQSGYSRNIT